MLVQAQNDKMQTEFKKPSAPKRKKKDPNKITKNKSEVFIPPCDNKAVPPLDSQEKSNTSEISEDKNEESASGESKENAQKGRSEISQNTGNVNTVEKLDLAVVKIENVEDSGSEETCKDKQEMDIDSVSKESDTNKKDGDSAAEASGQSADSDKKDCIVKKEEQGETSIPTKENETNDQITQGCGSADPSAPDNDDIEEVEGDGEEEDEEDEDLKRLSESDKNINIDPKTYCKLGHFHLLLEDYPKGIYLFAVKNIGTFIHNQNVIIFFLFACSVIGLSAIFLFKKRSLEGPHIPVWPRTSILPLQRISMVSAACVLPFPARFQLAESLQSAVEAQAPAPTWLDDFLSRWTQSVGSWQSWHCRGAAAGCTSPSPATWPTLNGPRGRGLKRSSAAATAVHAAVDDDPCGPGPSGPSAGPLGQRLAGPVDSVRAGPAAYRLTLLVALLWDQGVRKARPGQGLGKACEGTGGTGLWWSPTGRRRERSTTEPGMPPTARRCPLDLDASDCRSPDSQSRYKLWRKVLAFVVVRSLRCYPHQCLPRLYPTRSGALHVLHMGASFEPGVLTRIFY